MKNLFLTFTLALSVILPLTKSHAQAYVDSNIPIEFVVYNPCCDEDVAISGSMHLVVNNNVEHITVSGITGVGVNSGNQYTSHGVAVQNNIMYNNPIEGSLVFKVNMVNDDGCSFNMKITLHITVNANGEVTATVENVQIHCK